jgi:hypothetical protein
MVEEPCSRSFCPTERPKEPPQISSTKNYQSAHDRSNYSPGLKDKGVHQPGYNQGSRRQFATQSGACPCVKAAIRIQCGAELKIWMVCSVASTSLS